MLLKHQKIVLVLQKDQHKWFCCL